MWNNYGRVFAEYMFIKDFRAEKLASNIKIEGQEILNEIKEDKIDVKNVLNEFTTNEILDDSKEIINDYLNESMKAIFTLKNHELFPVLENINNYLINRTN